MPEDPNQITRIQIDVSFASKKYTMPAKVITHSSINKMEYEIQEDGQYLVQKFTYLLNGKWLIPFNSDVAIVSKKGALDKFIECLENKEITVEDLSGNKVDDDQRKNMLNILECIRGTCASIDTPDGKKIRESMERLAVFGEEMASSNASLPHKPITPGSRHV
ncbi:MAG: hypothetical protein KDD76_00140 [Rickettsiales bacterium]|nr:hypothetical protein [Rickettsiales bacterium]